MLSPVRILRIMRLRHCDKTDLRVRLLFTHLLPLRQCVSLPVSTCGSAYKNGDCSSATGLCCWPGALHSPPQPLTLSSASMERWIHGLITLYRTTTPIRSHLSTCERYSPSSVDICPFLKYKAIDLRSSCYMANQDDQTSLSGLAQYLYLPHLIFANMRY